ncbi:MAG: hypothetical protein ACXVUE_09955 [Solirubrobacteraceae bacterium]
MRSFAALRRPAVVALAVGTAITASVGAASAVRPPVPRVSTLGVSRLTTLVSYCWTVELAGGAGQGTCADGTAGHPAHTLRWRPGARIRVDLRLRAHRVQIRAARFGTKGSRPSQIVNLKVVRLGARGRWWMLRLPRQARRDTDLLISAFFANGDVEADLGIRRS